MFLNNGTKQQTTTTIVTFKTLLLLILGVTIPSVLITIAKWQTFRGSFKEQPIDIIENKTHIRMSSISGSILTNTTTLTTTTTTNRQCNIKGQCDLKNRTLGIPVVLITQGRSGSSSTWQTFSSLAGETTQPSSEDVGSNIPQMEAFFKRLNPNEAGHCWLERTLCDKYQRNLRWMKNSNKHSEIYGTKWKPYRLNMFPAHAALEWITRNPYIKVVYSERNPLDVVLSKLKHKTATLQPHCKKDAVKCIMKHTQAEHAQSVNITDLIIKLEEVTDVNTNTRKVLNDLHVPHVQVKYEKLYYSSDAKEWIRIMQFLENTGPDPMNGYDDLTMEEVNSKMKFAATSNPDRSQNIANYNEVVEALKGTEFEQYL